MTALPVEHFRGDGSSAGSDPSIPPADAARSATGVGLITVGTLMLAGIVHGVLWVLLAPDVVATMTEEGLRDPTFQSGRFFVGEGVYTVLAVGFGALAGLLARRWVRGLGWPVVLALAVGGVVASVVAWRVGVWLGPDAPNEAALAPGELAELPLRLRSSGLLLVWSIASLVVALCTVALGTSTETGSAHDDGDA